MQYIISGKNIDVTEGLKEAIYEKIGKLERYFTPETDVKCREGETKDRDYDSNERKYCTCRAGKQ